jgi:hypothetical protein
MRRPDGSVTQLILRIDPGPGKAVEQGRLAGVGISDQSDDGIGHPAPRRAVQFASPRHIGQILADAGDALIDQAAVDFKL